MRRVILLAGLALVLVPAVFAGPGPMTVGEEIFEVHETSHPYAGAVGQVAQQVRTWQISYPGATYIAPYFSEFALADGDYLVLRAPDESRSFRYEGLGKNGLGRDGGFWGVHIPGDRAILELYSRHDRGDYGFKIDRFARGFRDEEMGVGRQPESLCGADDSQNAKCYTGTPEYNEARAVARLLISGSSACTGWLVGDEGHLITNNHCISSQSGAGNTDYEFMAEGSDCSSNCNNWWACPGTVEATTATFVTTDSNLDYTLVKLPTDVSGTYGFMQLRESGPVMGEQIYIPQHPAGWGKHLAIDSSHPMNPSGKGEVDSLSEPVCQGGSQQEVGYYLDTQGGSSGSPVLANSDLCVVALHHCRGNIACTSQGGDPNRGVPIQAVISDLGSDLPNNALCDCQADEPDGEVTCDDGIDNDCDGLIDDADPDCGGCQMGVKLDRDSYRPGDAMFYRVGLIHNRLETVETTFKMWVEDAAGNLIVSSRSAPMIFEFGDREGLQGMLPIPGHQAPGEYKFFVAIEDMLQGVAVRERSFTVTE